jgi:hypothetical protein
MGVKRQMQAEPVTSEQWLQQEVARYPLLAAEVEILPGVVLARLVAEIVMRTWQEAQFRMIPLPEVQPHPVLPAKCRPSLYAIQAALLLDLSNEQFLDLGHRGLDLRDLSEIELSWLEDIKVKTAQNWRRDGSGPPYRKQGSGSRAPVVYPILGLRDWRRAHRATNTTQRPGRKLR